MIGSLLTLGFEPQGDIGRLPTIGYGLGPPPASVPSVPAFTGIGVITLGMGHVQGVAVPGLGLLPVIGYELGPSGAVTETALSGTDEIEYEDYRKRKRKAQQQLMLEVIKQFVRTVH